MIWWLVAAGVLVWWVAVKVAAALDVLDSESGGVFNRGRSQCKPEGMGAAHVAAQRRNRRRSNARGASRV